MDVSALFDTTGTIPISLAVIAINLSLGWYVAKQFYKELEDIRRDYDKELLLIRTLISDEMAKANLRIDLGEQRYEKIQQLLVDIRVDVATIRERQAQRKSQ